MWGRPPPAVRQSIWMLQPWAYPLERAYEGSGGICSVGVPSTRSGQAPQLSVRIADLWSGDTLSGSELRSDVRPRAANPT